MSEVYLRVVATNPSDPELKEYCVELSRDGSTDWTKVSGWCSTLNEAELFAASVLDEIARNTIRSEALTVVSEFSGSTQ